MTDTVSATVRSRMMSAIRGKDTKPELLLRQNLHMRGFRYRLHRSDLPGRPDMTFPRYGCVLFANGCFWHGHDCNLFRWPQTRREFWESKITRTRQRDATNQTRLLALGWRVGTVWECAIKGKGRLQIPEIMAHCEQWLTSPVPLMEIHGV